MNKKIFLIILLIPCFLFAEEAEEKKEEFIMFKNKLTLDVALNYHEMGFIKSDNDFTYRGNKPLDLEFGMKYRIFKGSFNVKLPFKFNNYDPNPNSLDINFDIIGNRLLVNANFALYRSFYVNGLREEDVFKDYMHNLQIFSTGISFLWNVNHKHHSLKAIYLLDRMQTVSNGSFLAGFGFLYNSILSPNYLIEDFKTRQHYFFSSPLFGYSYIWAFNHGFFLNTMITVGINNGLHVNERQFAFMPVLTPRFTIGYHIGTWSFTSSINGNYHFTVSSEADNTIWHHIYKMNFMVLKISKRFK